MTVMVDDPQKHPDGSFMTYLVTTHTTVETFSSPHPRPVRRRYQDFVWLQSALSLEFPACVVPPLPERHRLKYVKGNRFEAQFIERRRLGLQWFLDRIAQHPYFQRSQCTRVFLESADFKNDKNMQSKQVPQAATVIETLSDSMMRSFSRVKKPDERFVDMKDTVDKLEDNLSTVERVFSRISKRQQDLERNYTHFANSVRGLSALETDIARPLQHFAESVDSYVAAMKDKGRKEDTYFLNDVHELVGYCHATKAELRERDQKQIDFEELSSHLQRAVADRERILYPGQHPTKGAGVNITEFMADKMVEARGGDKERTKQERLSRLETKIAELQDEVARTNDINNGFSNQMLKEFEIFQRAKTRELRQGLAAYADSHIEFFEKGISIWENVLTELEGISVNEE
ncbi:uncharacterized protein BYT42DRAFT_202357 [Radiomyces spectabilis]|uniref:uncharacterized protein n=1 Tax=Radiomyces spectabilis TaxID=64574 RepID=UPI00221F5828|nr:uncharacterized protein BYT42DRAFT_202357 [Radiomyces spectabilis]KAI8391637.1 hypothetical protein BYT42DRAFT_202357 [Radiomyces spectabilis]